MENGFGIIIKLFYNLKYCFKAFTSTVQAHSRRLHFVKSCGCARCVGFRFAQKLPALCVPQRRVASRRRVRRLQQQRRATVSLAARQPAALRANP